MIKKISIIICLLIVFSFNNKVLACDENQTNTYIAQIIFGDDAIKMSNNEDVKILNDITCNDIQEFYYFCKSRNFPPKVLKNTLALLNQMIKYFQNLGIIDRSCNFQVRRLSYKTNFTENRIIFERDLCQK